MNAQAARADARAAATAAVSDRVVRAAVAALAVALGIGAGVILHTSEHVESPGATTAFVLLAGWSFVASGLFAWARRPDNHFGRLMVLIGLVSFVTVLAEANASLPFTIGVALSNASIALVAHLLLAFPSGRLETEVDRRLAAAFYAVLVGLQVVWMLFADVNATGCDDCATGGLHEPAPLAENALLVWRHDAVAQAVETLQNTLGIVLAVAVTGTLVARWRTATRTARRALSPVLLTGAAAVAVFVAGLATFLFWEGAAPALRWIGFGAFAALPFAFLLGLLRTQLTRVTAGRFLLDVPDDPTLAEVEAALRRALRDRELRLAYWLPERNTYIDVAGNPFRLPEPSAPTATTLIEYDGRPSAALVHDASVLSEPELLDEVVATLRVTLERDRGIRALRASEERNRALLAAIPDNMYRLRRDGTFVDFHAHWPERLPAPAGEIVGSNFAEWEQPEVAERVLGAIARALDAGEVQTVEWAVTYMGERGYREARIVASGEDEVLMVVRDITERKRQEEELRHSRARIVEAADTERRRLERNLHDGAQQHLSAISVMLRVAAARLDEDQATARKLLTQASDELSEALAELRELARGIHPAILSDRGLRAAMQSLAARSPVPVEVVAVPEERLPEPVEVAIYYLVAEALTNVARYAQAAQATVSVTQDGDAALVTVTDDGVGGADPTRGSGLRGLVDRVEALDGRLEVDSPPGGGTTLRAVIPLTTREGA